jgi:hypothetical protein
LTFGTEATEVVVAQSLGMMVEEFDSTGGLNTNKGSEVDKLMGKSKSIMVTEVESMGLYSGLVTKASFNPKDQGFLYDHEINGTPVLPGVMGTEAMVEAATLLFPDLHVTAVENVDFLAPFKFYRSEPRDVMVKVLFKKEKEEVIAKCELYGARKLMGADTEEIKTHFRAQVRLSEKSPKSPGPRKEKMNVPKDATANSGDIYKLYFHGPAYQVIDKTWKKGKGVIGQFAAKLPANHQPSSLKTQALPRLVELCFQTAGIAEMGSKGSMGLPMHMDALNIYKKPSGKKRLFAVVNQVNGNYDASVVDSSGVVYLDLKGYSTSEFMTDIDKKLLEPLKAVTS